MRLPKLALVIALFSPLLLCPAYAQRGGVRGGVRGGFYGGRGYYYGDRAWGPGIYFGFGLGYPYYGGYPYWPYYEYPYYGYPYYGYPSYGYPYYAYPYSYSYNPYAYPPPPVTSQAPQAQQQTALPQPPNQTAPAPPPPDDPPPAAGQDIGLWQPGLGDLLSDPDVRQQLGVTAAQAAKIEQQESGFVNTQIRSTAELQIKRMELDDLVTAEKPDRAAIDSKLKEISAAQTALEKSDIDTFLAAQETLTPVQRQKLQQIITEQSEAAGEDQAARPGAQTGAPPSKQAK